MTTWTDIVAGDAGIALTVMDNLKHAGRFGVDFIPLNASGVAIIDGSLDMGTLTNEWGDLYLDAGKKIYVGGIEFKGGGGSGSGLDIVALANNFDKQGNSYPLPNDKILRNAFISDANLLCWVRKSYSTADTTTIILDHGLETELETLNACEATTGFSGTSISLDSVNKLEGTYSVKTTGTTTAVEIQYDPTDTFSLTDRNLRLSVFVDNTTDMTAFVININTDYSNFRTFTVDPSNINEGGWTHIVCDNNESSDYSETGTYLRSSNYRIRVYVTYSSSQTVNVSVDSIRAISDKPLIVADYGQTLVLQDATNQEVFTITDEDETDNTTKGTFTIGATLSNNYTADASATKASTTTGTISGNSFTHDSTASGQNAKTAKQVETLLLSSTMGTATFEAFARFYHESFEVTDFPSTTTIELESATDKSAYFLDNDYILLFKKQRAGYKNQSMEGSDTVNYLRLQLNANATYSGTTISLAHDGSNAVGSDVTNYYVVPESVAMGYSAGSKTNSTITDMTPTEFLINSPQEPEALIFSDNFDRANESPISTNDWSEAHTSSSYARIVSNKLVCVNTAANNLYGTAYRNLEDYSVLKLPIVITARFEYDWTNGKNEAFLCYGSNTTNYTKDGIYFRMTPDSTTSYFSVGDSTGELKNDTVAPVIEFSEYFLKIEIYETRIRVRYWLIASDEPTGWQFDVVRPTGLTVAGNMFKVVARTTATGTYSSTIKINDLVIERIGQGYTLKYKAENLTTIDKAEAITTLKRSDTTNQFPELFETGAILY